MGCSSGLARPQHTAGWNYFAKKAKTSEKSENISKAKIVLKFSQNSELDCVDSFCFRKVDLLFCEIISKPRNPRIWCNFQFAKMNCIKVDLLFCENIREDNYNQDSIKSRGGGLSSKQCSFKMCVVFANWNL